MNIILKDLAIEDAHTIAKWKSDPHLSEQIMSSFQITDVETAEQWINKNTSDPNQQLTGIYLKSAKDTILIGISRLMFIDYENKNAELGMYVGETQFQGLGIGKKALDLTLSNGFNLLDLSKIYLKVATTNKRAISLYSKRKFKQEGCLNEHYYRNGQFENIILMALFRDDFI